MPKCGQCRLVRDYFTTEYLNLPQLYHKWIYFMSAQRGLNSRLSTLVPRGNSKRVGKQKEQYETL